MVGGARELLPPATFHAMEGTRLVQRYSPATRAWARDPDLPAQLFEGCAVATPRGLVVIGEFEAGAANSYVLGAGGRWAALPLSHYRHTSPACSLATLGNVTGVVAVSGNSVEMLVLSSGNNTDSSSNSTGWRWQLLPAPTVSRSGSVAASLGVSLGRLVLTGGVDLASGEVSGVVEVWDEAAAGWRPQQRRQPAPTFRHGVTSLPVRYMDYCDTEG